MHTRWLLVLAVAGCEGASSTPDASSVFTPAQVAPAAGNRALDLLFMVQDSGGMLAIQESLVRNAEHLFAALERTEGGLPDLHLGVISSSLSLAPEVISGCDGDGGRLQHEAGVSGCAPPEGAFIIDVACDAGAPAGCRTRNYTGDLTDAFGCIAAVGWDGCAFEQPLESMRLALDPVEAPAENAGFLRAEAHLAVVFVAHQDDCSAADPAIFGTSEEAIAELGPLLTFRCWEDGLICDGAPPAREPATYASCEPREASAYLYHPQHHVDFLRDLKPDPRQLSVSGIIGPHLAGIVVGSDVDGLPELLPLCHTVLGDADPVVRLGWFIDAFGDRGRVTSVCASSLRESLASIGAWLVAALDGAVCLEGAAASADLDPAAPGLQLDCQVADVAGPGTAAETWTRLPACAVGDDGSPGTNAMRPCWYVRDDPLACPATPTHLRLAVAREATPPGGSVAIRCAGQ